jgi:hypothetical protein
MIAVTPFSLSHSNNRRNSERSNCSFSSPLNRFDGVDDDALRADRIDGIAEPNEKTFKIVLARLGDLGAFDFDVIDRKLLFGNQLFDVIVQ